MYPVTILGARAWAEIQFGNTSLQDPRRTRRAVAVATALMQNPSVCLPQQMRDWKSLKAAYRLLDTEEVSFGALMQPTSNTPGRPQQKRRSC